MKKISETSEIFKSSSYVNNAPTGRTVNEAAPAEAYVVTGQAFDRKTGEAAGASREEEVDTNNSLFKNVKSILDVKEAYESFWNDLNPNSKDVVFVSKVVKKK